ncbi:uncharacterized protein LOC111875357 [Cryptotermes secundus]|uniref:uncharacterized protein LOC111875357 n=1 Tax=Cryptotermes secundus TaxID=105785 RepID=UPI000CD7BFCE|nr:uncharacterized protein LOC111875357 [Cryptotermes secundus]
MVTIGDLFKMSTFWLKILELTVTAVCIGLVADNWNVAMTPSKVAVVNGTLVGYIMLSIVIILGIALDIPLDRTLVLVITLPGAVMFITSGALMIESWDRNPNTTGEVLGSGVMALLNGFIYLVDFGLTYFKYR